MIIPVRACNTCIVMVPQCCNTCIVIVPQCCNTAHTKPPERTAPGCVVTRVLQGCYKSNSVTIVLRGRYKGVARALQGRYKGVTRMLQGCCKVNYNVLFQKCVFTALTAASVRLRPCDHSLTTCVARVLQESEKGVTVLQRCYEGVKRLLQAC
jgi:hypothetical protein